MPPEKSLGVAAFLQSGTLSEARSPMKPGSEPTNEPSASGFLEQLVREAEQARASDIHLQMTGKSAEVAFRLDGVMASRRSVEEPIAERLFGRIKYLSRLKTYQESLPQDGRIDRNELGAAHDIRVATYPTVTGEKIVLRLFTEDTARSLDELNLAHEVVAELDRFLRGSHGLLLLTGPAGSGKTSTIYACLRRLAEQGGRHIVTVEDPVEQIVPGIMQTEVAAARGLSFGIAARHLLRQDPQVLVIGEIRDRETADIVVNAAMTGHLVISTLHAGSCAGVMERLLTMCTDPFIVGAAIELVLNQRLLRRLCPACRGARCDACLQTGYQGRVPVVEWFRFDHAARKRFREEGAAVIAPAKLLQQSARELVNAGVTDQAEFERIFSR
jgi:general secretion pathway protein E